MDAKHPGCPKCGESMRIIAFVLDWPEMDQSAGQRADGWE
jgi:hypothetical protein